MKTYLYLSTAIVGVMIVENAWAQCVSTQDCATLGYTETSCPNGGVKCPFGSKWFCASSEITPEQCTELGFTLSCTGTNQTGGGSKACNGKYYECTCRGGYEWDPSSKICKQLPDGAYGNFYYCKGEVVGVKVSDMNFYVAIDEEMGGYWDAQDTCSSYVFCGSAKGTLPSSWQLTIIYENKSSINSLLVTSGGTALYEGYYWSSSDSYGDSSYADKVSMTTGKIYDDYTYTSNHVRPILTSW